MELFSAFFDIFGVHGDVSGHASLVVVAYEAGKTKANCLPIHDANRLPIHHSHRLCGLDRTLLRALLCEWFGT